jgi:very-short-patch-repair endonuclease
MDEEQVIDGTRITDIYFEFGKVVVELDGKNTKYMLDRKELIVALSENFFIWKKQRKNYKLEVLLK